ncbi:MAG: di-heme oxidoredictase family protein [Pyrinomonadaceae bacterium]
MKRKENIKNALVIIFLIIVATVFGLPALAQLIDRTQNPNTAGAGIAKSLPQQIGAGRGDVMTPDSSSFIIARDPFRSIRRGRQLFQRKFLRIQGLGPTTNDSVGDLDRELALSAGLADSCATCHGRPRGSAGFGGDVATRPDSRDAPHLFGLGIKEMLADEITADLRAIRAEAIARAQQTHHDVTRVLTSKSIQYGRITARSNGTVDTTQISGVDADLRVKPFFHHGDTASIHEFVVGAFNDEMGMQAVDPELMAAHNGGRYVTPTGMVLDGSKDFVKAPPTDNPSEDVDGDGIANEIPASLVDHMEFYLLNYFKPATYEQTQATQRGGELFQQVGCAQCHIPNLRINRDRRVADVETVYDEEHGIFNNLFATANPLFNVINDTSGFPAFKKPKLQPFLAQNIFTDFKRHDLGANFHERDYDGTIRTKFMTTPLWGVGSTSPYGHDGRSITLKEVILRHGGEAQAARDAFARLQPAGQRRIIEFLDSFVIFPPDDTASTLDPGNPLTPGFPQFGHGSIRLPVLFNNPNDPE